MTRILARRLRLPRSALALAAALALSQPAAAAPSWPGFLAGLWPDAQRAGVSRDVFDRAFAGLEPDPAVIRLAGMQPEFNQTLWSYVDARLTPARIRDGQVMAGRWRPWLDRIERTRGVDRHLLLAVWSLESNFGASTGGKSTIRSLATLACCTTRRPDFFRGELLTALTILQAGDVTPEMMTGSWAGAMGQTQFMPSSFVKDAVDADGDGHRNIWTSVPDALASTAAYLVSHGWKAGRPWGFEVILPENFDYGATDRLEGKPVRNWAGLGLKRADGGSLALPDPASLFVPAGVRGPAFLILANYWAIKAYNTSDAYTLSVGLVADRLAGGKGLAHAWPVGDKPLTLAQRESLQRRLKALGYPVTDVDGKIGPAMRAMVRSWQAKNGLVPDGYATPELLARMGAQ